MHLRLARSNVHNYVVLLWIASLKCTVADMLPLKCGAGLRMYAG